MWKDIVYNNKYEVSDTGIVRRKDNQNVLKGCITSGYRSVKLTFEDSKQQRFQVHRLVAIHFIENDDVEHDQIFCWFKNYPQIQSEKKKKKKEFQKPIPVIQYDLAMNEIARYDSISAAHKATGISVVQIARNIHNEITHTGPYIWISQ